MLHLLLILNFIIIFSEVEPKEDSDADGDLGANLITQLKNDKNLDLSVDEEYEDLRAEFLAYHTALASLVSTNGRRSMTSTPCWRLGGICINYKLCTGFKSLTEVRGCRDKLKVCCFAWNRYNVRDMRDQGFGTLAMPWRIQQDFGGKGVMDVEEEEKKTKSKKASKLKEAIKTKSKSGDKDIERIAVIIGTNK